MRIVLAALCAALAAAVTPAAAPQPTLDAAWQAYWRADSPRAAGREAVQLLAAGVTFDDTLARLRAGRPYGRAQTGQRSMRATAQTGVAYDNLIEVPAVYDPARAWPVRVQLHGGIMRQNPEEGRRRRGNRIPGEPQIVIEPFGWNEAAWWHAPQVDNILTLVDRVKRQYNVDESRIYLTGTSDGGTGAYFLAMREPTLWSAVLPLIGHLGVLSNPSTGADGQLFISNLVNTPFFVVNGMRDPLYPAARVAPYLEALQTAGVSLVFRPQPTGGHDTSWWESERGAYEQFVHEHPRRANPALLSWETERTDRYNRIHWLVIDALGARPSDAPLVDTNTVRERLDPDFGVRGDSRKDKGTRIVEVVAGSDAAAMGLSIGDRIVEIDQRPVADLQAIIAALTRNTGPSITVVVERGAERLSLSGRFPPPVTEGPARTVFPRTRPSGRVDVVRRGNAFEARTRGVSSFTLLLSPDVIDFTRPVVVMVNGRPVHDGVVNASVETLLGWAARDNDRTALYGAALAVAVP